MSRAFVKLGIVNAFMAVTYLFANLLELKGVSDTASMIVRQVNWNSIFIEVIWSGAPWGPLVHGSYYLFNLSFLVIPVAIALNLIAIWKTLAH
jgi:hypothetical protein